MVIKGIEDYNSYDLNFHFTHFLQFKKS